MNLLISDITPVDAELDRAIPWIDDPADAFTPRPDDGEIPDGEDPITSGRRYRWYEPRLSALRRLIAEQQTWEIR